MPTLSALSVRTLLLGVTLTLGLFAIGECGSNLKAAWDVGAGADLVSRLADADTHLLQALQSMRQERGDTATILGLAGDDLAAKRPALAQVRAGVDAAFASAGAAMATLPGDAARRSAQSLAETLQGFRALRGEVDAALNSGLEARDKAMSGRVLRDGDQVLAALDAATAATDGWIRSLDQDSGALVSVKQFAWLTRASAGNFVVPIQRALAARAGLSPSDLQSLDRTAGRLAATWQLVLDGAKNLDRAPRLVAAIDAVRNGFFGPAFTAELDGLRRSLAAGEPTPVTLTEFQKEATAQTLAISRVATTAMELTLEGALEQRSAAQRSLLVNAAVLFCCLVLVGLGLWVTGDRVARPIRDLTAAMKRLAGGDLSVSVPVLDRADEFGAMAGAVQVFKENAATLRSHQAAVEALHRENEARLRELEQSFVEAGAAQTAVVDAMAAGLAKLSRGDLMFRLDARFTPEYEALKADFNAALGKLQETLRIVALSASNIRSGTGEISTAADDLSRRTEQQAASLEETAAALEEITSTVRKTSQSAVHARDVVGDVKTGAERSGTVVRRAIEAMGDIERSSREITQIIGVIDEIAFQTNLLALNAGVEAARAGEAGRGFAVVASEVRALAQRSAEAAKQIKGLISASGQQVEQGVTLVAETGEALGRILGQVAELNTIVIEIAASAQEQASGLDQINTAVSQMDQVTQQNAAMVEESTAASHALSRETVELGRLMGEFRLGDEGAEAPRRVGEVRRASRSPVAVPQLRATGRGGAVRASLPAADTEEWTEF